MAGTMGRNLIVLSTLLLGAALMTSGAHADGAADTCQKAPMRACVLEVASANADKIAIPYVKASVLAVIARDQQRFGLIDAGRATLQRAEEAQEAIPEDFPQGNIVGAIAGAMAEMGDTAAAVEVAKNTKTPFARAFAYGGIGMALQRKGKADEAKANFALAVEAAQAAPSETRDFLLSQVAYGEARTGSPDAPATFDLAFAAAKARGKGGETQVINQRIRSGDFARAFIDINDAPETSRAFVMRLLVKSEAEAGALDDAAAAASAISDESDAARAAVDVAVANFRAGHAMAGAQWLVRAQQIAANASVPATKAEATADIAGASRSPAWISSRGDKSRKRARRRRRKRATCSAPRSTRRLGALSRVLARPMTPSLCCATRRRR